MALNPFCDETLHTFFTVTLASRRSPQTLFHFTIPSLEIDHLVGKRVATLTVNMQVKVQSDQHDTSKSCSAGRHTWTSRERRLFLADPWMSHVQDTHSKPRQKWTWSIVLRSVNMPYWNSDMYLFQVILHLLPHKHLQGELGLGLWFGLGVRNDLGLGLGLALVYHRAHGILLLTHFPAHGILSLSQCTLLHANDIMPCAGKCANDNMPCAQWSLEISNWGLLFFKKLPTTETCRIVILNLLIPLNHHRKGLDFAPEVLSLCHIRLLMQTDPLESSSFNFLCQCVSQLSPHISAFRRAPLLSTAIFINNSWPEFSSFISILIPLPVCVLLSLIVSKYESQAMNAISCFHEMNLLMNSQPIFDAQYFIKLMITSI